MDPIVVEDPQPEPPLPSVPYPREIPMPTLDPGIVSYVPEGRLRTMLFDGKHSTLSLIAHHIGVDPELQSPLTKLDYLRSLQRFEAWRADRMPGRTLIHEYLASLSGQGKKLRYIRRELAAIRWWLRKMCQLTNELPIPENQVQYFLRVFQDAAKIHDPKGQLKPTGKTGHLISDQQIAALLDACERDGTITGIRDRALFAITNIAGFRIGDVINISLRGVRVESHDPLSYRVTTLTKGQKERSVLIPEGAALCLEDWLEVRGPLPGALFPPINRGKKITTRKGQAVHLSRSGLRKILLERLDQAGITIREADEDRGRSFHDFRRTVVSSMLRETRDLSKTQKFMLHASPATTAGYDIRPEKEIDELAFIRKVPYKKMIPSGESK